MRISQEEFLRIKGKAHQNSRTTAGISTETIKAEDNGITYLSSKRKSLLTKNSVADVGTYYTAAVIKALKYWSKDKQIHQCQMTELWNRPTYIYGHLIYDKGHSEEQ